MKTNKFDIKITLLCFLTILIVGCNKHLDIAPQAAVSPENYFNEESHLSAYTIARYQDVFRTTDGSGGAGLYLDDATTDNMTNRGSNNRFLPGQWRVGATGGGWSFGTIFQLNYFLQTALAKVEAGAVMGNVNNINHYIGEAYLMRAFVYFGRLMEMGDFPIITEVLPDQQAALVEASKRRPRNEVARFILSDLDKAAELLLTVPPVGGRTRISKDLAYLVKSRVALFEATWLKYHQGTALVPNGPNWPGATKDYNRGYQFPTGSITNEIDFFLGEAMAAAKIVADAHALTVNSMHIKQGVSDPSNPYFEMFNSENLAAYDEVLLWRDFDLTLGVVQYWNHYIYYGNGYGYTRQFVDNFLMGNGLPIYAAASGYEGDDFVGNVKVNRDWRLKLFMRAPGETKAFINLPTGSSPEVEPTVPNIDLASRFLEGTGYSIKKGLSYDNNMQSIVGRDVTAIVCFRAAEAYLNYIEACFEKNGGLDGSAVSYWQAIRNRAGVNPDFNVTVAATDMSKEGLNDWGAYSHGNLINPTLYNIRRERRAELMVEGLRYMDLIRWRAMDQLNGFKIEGIKVWGPMKDIYGSRLKYGGTTTNTVSDPSLSRYLRVHQISPNNQFYNGYFFTEAHYLSPIATEHFLISSSDGQSTETSPIYQNPGWPVTAGAGPIGY
ncbi:MULTISPECIES: RagB/SusD family nutrient uptake outer membrane protein [Olivibacter]|uniref:RagB/SusD family nutrient uptake outer membrane protein n=1 Tax=Olivibacter jilunii TaxID=985016 RepID=A0ABW6B3F4_9SPHI|nr:RagB/SusD family nutrient uptake outer membrane protein [Olivibacter sp. UJ_SKK_5.1]MDX3916186.1 RagB/SusD family nutrient uptake outer membrane protein [Pseudosphingobacterium sp.]